MKEEGGAGNEEKVDCFLGEGGGSGKQGGGEGRGGKEGGNPVFPRYREKKKRKGKGGLGGEGWGRRREEKKKREARAGFASRNQRKKGGKGGVGGKGGGGCGISELQRRGEGEEIRDNQWVKRKRGMVALSFFKRGEGRKKKKRRGSWGGWRTPHPSLAERKGKKLNGKGKKTGTISSYAGAKKRE